MKQLTCEMCGSKDLIKDGGVFVCQSCGCKYSLEEAKKMMIEGTVEVKGTVSVDSSDVLNNYIIRGNQLFDRKKYAEAEVYYNKALDIDAQSSSVMDNFLEKANQLFKEKQYLRAEAYYNKVLEIDPDNVEANTNLKKSKSIILEPNLTILKSSTKSIFESKTYMYIDGNECYYNLDGTTSIKLPIGLHTVYFKNLISQSETVYIAINSRSDKYSLGLDVRLYGIRTFLSKTRQKNKAGILK